MATLFRPLSSFFSSLILGTCLLLAYPTSVPAGTLHALLIADTLDHSIGNDLQHDLKNMQNEMKRIAHFAHMPLRVTVLKGHAVEPTEVWSAIKDLEAGPDDTVIFYWSGHGYRTDSKGDDPWPYLYFSQQGQGIDYSAVIDTLNEKGARLLITLADCCNNRLSDWSAPPVVDLKAGDQDLSEYHYTKLFAEAAGTVLVTSSEAGEYSYSTSQGGMFSLAYLEAIRETIASPSDGSWQSILEKTSKAIEVNQHPTYIIDLKS